jgi:enoyl-CoA hydratase/carnithine racemase
MSNQTDLVLVSVEKPGIGVITLNNPDRMNAWSAAMSAQFFARLEECRVNPEVRVVVVTGAGKGFCPGADMDALNQIRANPAGGAGPATGAGRFSDFISYPKPIIAADLFWRFSATFVSRQVASNSRRHLVVVD